MLSLIGVTCVSLGLSTAAPVLAASTETQAPSQSNPETGNTSNPTNKTEGNQSKTPSTIDTSKTPAENETKTNNDKKKPAANISGSKLNKALSLLNKFVRLTKDSGVYNQKGKRIKNLKLKKGQIIRITGFNINKDLLSFVDSTKSKKSKYVKLSNVKYFKAVQYKLKKKGYVYNAKGVVMHSPTGGRYFIKKGKVVNVFKTKKIKGKKFVGLDDNVYIKWSVLDPKSYRKIQ